MPTLRQNILWYFLALLIVLGGFAGFKVMGALKTPLTAEPQEKPLPVVDVQPLDQAAAFIPIQAEGFILPKRSVSIAPQVQGTLMYLSPAVEQSGTVKKGDLLARLDDRTAQAQLNKVKADLAAQDANIALINTQIERAKTLLSQGVVTQDQFDQLAAQQQQLAAGRLGLLAALQSAELALEFTEIRAPFNAQVSAKLAELGAVVTPQTAIAQLFTPQQLESRVSLTAAEYSLLPGLLNNDDVNVTVNVRFGDQTVQASGTVNQVAQQISATTRTLEVVVEINNAPAQMLANSFAQVDFQAPSQGSYAIPITALRSGDHVWVAQDGTLNLVPVNIVHMNNELAYITAPNLQGAQLITSSLGGVSDGMAISVQSNVL